MYGILNTDEPIFIQIARQIEDEILDGGIEEEQQIPSTNEVAKIYQINPATVLKGINLLVERQILYKKRGIGMFVTTGAVAIISADRIENFEQMIIKNIIRESVKLGISKQKLIEMIKKSDEGENNGSVSN